LKIKKSLLRIAPELLFTVPKLIYFANFGKWNNVFHSLANQEIVAFDNDGKDRKRSRGDRFNRLRQLVNASTAIVKMSTAACDLQCPTD
jgi:hypothetical protein